MAMGKHMQDLGNYDACILDGKALGMTYALITMITDSRNQTVIHSGFCVPDKCTPEQVKESIEPYFMFMYQALLENFRTEMIVTFPS